VKLTFGLFGGDLVTLVFEGLDKSHVCLFPVIDFAEEKRKSINIIQPQSEEKCEKENLR
jgi:hypothetical protein